jgi:hypothetical protein
MNAAAAPNPALRQLRSIPSRPSHGNAALGHAGIARLRRRSLVAALRAASSHFPPSPFQIWVRRAAAEDGAGFQAQTICALAVSKRARKREERVEYVSGQMRSL